MFDYEALRDDRDDIDVDAFQAYVEELAGSFHGPNALDVALGEFEEAYAGVCDDPGDFAYELYGDVYGSELEALPEILRNTIDWDEVAFDLKVTEGYTFHEDGFVFRPI